MQRKFFKKVATHIPSMGLPVKMSLFLQNAARIVLVHKELRAQAPKRVRTDHYATVHPAILQQVMMRVLLPAQR